jgi:hypothetical protein
MKEFLEKLEQDVKENNFEIAEKIQAAGKNPEAVYAVAKEAGLTDSFEVFEAEMLKQYEASGGELNDEELLAIAGGLSEKVETGICHGTITATVGAMGYLASAV